MACRWDAKNRKLRGHAVYMPSVLCKGLIRDHLREVWPSLLDILHDRKSIDEFKKLKFPDDAGL